MAHAFTYGTLMWPDIMARVCGPDAGPFSPPVAATLADHVRHPVRDHDYPGMIPEAGHQVVGQLYLDVPEAAWPRLDRFEGGDYERHEVLVTLADGTWQRAWTYLFKPVALSKLDAGDWDEARFEREGKARFISRYVGFDAI